MSYKIYQFGTTVLPNYNADQDIGLEAPGKYFDLFWGGAFDYLGSEKAQPGGYKLNKPCTLLSDYADPQQAMNELQTEFYALRVLVGKRDKLYRLRFADGVMEWIWARLEGVKGVRKSGDKFALNFTLEFYIESPCWYSIGTHHYFWYDVGSNEDDLTTCQAESGPDAYVHVDNTSNIDQMDVLFTITALTEVTGITIWNTTSGYRFTYTGTLAAGTILVIDTGAMSVENNGVDDYAHFTPPVDHEQWMAMAPGSNALTLTITGSAIIELEYHAALA